MLNQPASATRQLGRYLLAAPLVMALALGYACSQKAAAPTPTAAAAPPADDAVYYLDGQPSTKAVVYALDPNTIETIDILKDPVLIKRIFQTTEPGVAVVTTKANVNAPAVLALREKADLASGYDYTPVQVNAVVPKALAYITSHYPEARLGGEVKEVKKKTTGAVKYQVQLVRGKRPFYAYFSPQGDFLGEQR